ncbi:MAG: type II toxin-antitoxin system HipA family toxin [Opitutales bacterium]
MQAHAEIRLWGTRIAAVSHDARNGVAQFEYDREFRQSGIELSPITMPLADQVYRFPELARESFHGLPGLLADALPDKFGNALIDAWLSSRGRTSESFNPVERLCYTGKRGMGALEFSPTCGPRPRKSERIEIQEMVRLASQILQHRSQLETRFGTPESGDTLKEILRVGTSAGGARAKAIIAWHPDSGEVRSGQVEAPEGFGYWLLKFDGVRGNRDKEAADPQGYGRIEYAYSLMAKAAGIEMTDCRLLEEGGRAHFMTRRFDRLPDGSKLHMQTLGGLAHFDYNMAGAYSYEQAMQLMRQLKLGMDARLQQFRRMTFNIIARNQDDHVKNIAFLMDKRGQWRLSPAYDLIYSYNPDGAWTNRHQMTVNGKRDHFTRTDLEACAEAAKIPLKWIQPILHEVADAVRNWPDYADQASVGASSRDRIQQTLRLDLPA